MKFSGFFAWWLWRSVYLMKLPGLERKLRVALDWTLDLFFPPDITSLQVQPTQAMKLMHLEKGDVLCHAGEPANSFYIVKAGRIELRDATGAVERTLEPGAISANGRSSTICPGLLPPWPPRPAKSCPSAPRL